MAAFEARVLREDRNLLRDAVASADEADRKVAATVALAAALIEVGAYDDALAALADVIDADVAAPIDAAWLHIQRARAYLELGQLPAARADADLALGARNIAPHDVTASAIAGAAQALIYSTASWEQQDFGSVIEATDTVGVLVAHADSARRTGIAHREDLPGVGRRSQHARQQH
ncbi:MAG: hypothetical protein M3Y17_09185 [Actinomycetota bacterium]|nr:hypothetical protein [Actinomycetota bacterium]